MEYIENHIKYSKEYSEYDEKDETMDIRGDFSEFDRVFYYMDDKNHYGSLLLFSEKKQLFMNLDLQTKKVSEINIHAEGEYQQVELYDEKLFCVNRKKLTMDIFFHSKNQQFFHKRTIHFANKAMKLKEEFCLLVWKHHATGAVYRCLLGPLEDGRYMNFDLSERYFAIQSEADQVITHVLFVNLTSDHNNDSGDVICMDEVGKSIICCSKETECFFEYNGFSQKASDRLFVIYIKRFMHSRLRRMYCYYPYDFFPQKEKNRLKTKARDQVQDIDELDVFIKNRYKEILLCIDGEALYKIASLEEEPLLKQGISWRSDQICSSAFRLKDIAINTCTGEIYCLCSQGIKIMENSGRKVERDNRKFKAAENLKYKNYNS